MGYGYYDYKQAVDTSRYLFSYNNGYGVSWNEPSFDNIISLGGAVPLGYTYRNSMAYGNGVYISIYHFNLFGITNDGVWISTDNFRTRTAKSLPTDVGLNKIIYDPINKRFVICGNFGTILYSDDNGVNWTDYDITTKHLYDICYNHYTNRYYTCGEDGFCAVTNTNNISTTFQWGTTTIGSTSYNMVALTYNTNNGMTVFAGTNGYYRYHSVSFGSEIKNGSNDFTDITFDGTYFVFVGKNGTYKYATNASIGSLSNYNYFSGNPTKGFLSVDATLDGHIVAVGEDGLHCYMIGNTVKFWQLTSPSTKLNKVKIFNKLILIAADDYIIVRSYLPSNDNAIAKYDNGKSFIEICSNNYNHEYNI